MSQPSLSKGQLAIVLSTLEPFNTGKVSEEQYSTDAEIAATIIKQAELLGDVAGKEVADLGAGTGILGLGTMLTGAKKVVFVEKDPDALAVCIANYEKLKSESLVSGKVEFRQNDVNEVELRVDTVIQNPPFGTRQAHADKVFLEKAFSMADVVYSFHKTSTSAFIKKFSDDKNFKVTHQFDFEFPLKKQYAHQTRRIHRIQASCFRIIKQ